MARVTPVPNQYLSIDSVHAIHNGNGDFYVLSPSFRPGTNTDTYECISCSFQATTGVLCQHALKFVYAVGATTYAPTLSSDVATRAALITALNTATAGHITWTIPAVTVLDATLYRVVGTNISGGVVTIPRSSPFIKFGGSCHGYREEEDIVIGIAAAFTFPFGSFVASHEYYIASPDIELSCNICNTSTTNGVMAIIQPSASGSSIFASYQQALVINQRSEYDVDVENITVLCGCGSGDSVVTMDGSKPYFKLYFLARPRKHVT